jgi:hypothetical protein
MNATIALEDLKVKVTECFSRPESIDIGLVLDGIPSFCVWAHGVGKSLFR